MSKTSSSSVFLFFFSSFLVASLVLLLASVVSEDPDSLVSLHNLKFLFLEPAPRGDSY